MTTALTDAMVDGMGDMAGLSLPGPAPRASAFQWQGAPSAIGCDLTRTHRQRTHTSSKVKAERAAGRNPGDIRGLGAGNADKRHLRAEI